MARKISPYIFLALSLLFFILIQANISFGKFGPIVVIAMVICPFIALLFSIKGTGKGKWLAITFSIFFILTVSLLGFVATFLLKEF